MDVVPFGKYDLLERIAVGGMAEVFLARATGLAGFERRLVIKRIRGEHAHDPRFVQSFVNEARIGVHLNHPNIVQVYELGRVGEAWFIAMEHLHGRDLSRLRKAIVARGRTVPHPEAVRMVADVCRALAYAHSRTDAEGRPLGLVHRDVSPHNIVVTFTGEVKLVDFGIARLMLDADQDPAGEPGVGGGKYAYMSPEQANGDLLDHRTDVYSAGIVLWELLAGRRLFQHPSAEEKLRRVRESVVPRPDETGTPVDEPLWAIVRQALAKDRDDRHATAADLEEDLRAWLFATRERVERTHLAKVLRDAFPEEASRSNENVHLHRLVADLDRLDLQASTDPSGERTPSSSELPGRLPAALEEQRPVVVLMIDVDGLTELSARLSAESLFRRRHSLLRWVRSVVDAHDGVVNACVDDHITVLFGVPRSRGSDVHRALTCALQLTRDVSQLRAQGLSLDLCIGVHGGDVTVRGAGRRIRYAARGDTTRLARRLSAVADHGQVLASQRVVEAVEGEFDLRRGDPVPSRGADADLPSWEVRRRFSGLRRRGRGAWVRRGGEVATLQQALLELQQGHGAAVVLVGEAGAGKSRFLRELRERVGRRSIPFHGVHCNDVGNARPLEPLRELLASLLGQEPDAPSRELLQAAASLDQLGLGARHRDVLHALLGASIPHAIDRAVAWDAMAAVFERLATNRPVVVALDDAQHLTRHTIQPLVRWIRTLSQVPVLILIGHSAPVPDALAACAKIVDFPSLDAQQTRRLASEHLGSESVGDRLHRLLTETCEGNPRYIEEMLKHLLAHDQVRLEDGTAILETKGTPELPHGLQALITARIDALEPAAKGALQLAAVAGPTFSEALLADAAGLDDPTPLVQELAAHHLVTRVEGTHDDWRLASEFVRHAALNGTMGVQRRDYHRLVAAALERQSEDLDSRAAELMEHCAHGGRLVDAARYAFRAGQVQERAQEFEAARHMYQQGLAYVDSIPNSPDSWDAKVQGDAMLHLHLGRMHLLLGAPGKGQQALQLALDIAAEASLPWIEVRAHLALGRHYHQRGLADLAQAHLDQAMVQRRLENDPALDVDTLEAAATVALDRGALDEASRLWTQALELVGGDDAAAARCELGLANRYLRTGDADAARPLLASALRKARAAGDRILEGRSLNNQGLLHVWAGALDEALACFRTSLELRSSVGYRRGVVVNEHNIADVHFRRGDIDKATMGFARSRDLARTIGWPRGEALNDIYLRYLEGADADAIQAAADRAGALGDTESALAGAWLAGRRLGDVGRTNEAQTSLERTLREAQSESLFALVQRIEASLLTLSPG